MGDSRQIWYERIEYRKDIDDLSLVRQEMC